MKTGFVYGYMGKPLEKRYSYHGIDRKCLIQPDPSPYDEYPFLPPGPFWILVYNQLFQCAYNYCYHTWPMNSTWLPSSDWDPCTKHWYPRTKRYYWIWLYLVPRYPFCAASFSIGTECKYSAFEFKYVPTVWSFINNVWADSTLICRTFNAGPGSHIKIWRSETGELPPGPPI